MIDIFYFLVCLPYMLYEFSCTDVLKKYLGHLSEPRHECKPANTFKQHSIYLNKINKFVQGQFRIDLMIFAVVHFLLAQKINEIIYSTFLFDIYFKFFCTY